MSLEQKVFPQPKGILVRGYCAETDGLQARLDALGVASYATTTVLSGNNGEIVKLKEALAQDMAPGADTTLFCEKLRLDPVGNTDDLA